MREQAELFIRATELGDMGHRFRAFVASTVEDTLRGPFPNIVGHPFGSAANGFGNFGSDVDVELELDSKQKVCDDVHSVSNISQYMRYARASTVRCMFVVYFLFLYMYACTVR